MLASGFLNFFWPSDIKELGLLILERIKFQLEIVLKFCGIYLLVVFGFSFSDWKIH